MNYVTIGGDEMWSMELYLYHMMMCKLVYDLQGNLTLHTSLSFDPSYGTGTDSVDLFGSLLEELFGVNYLYNTAYGNELDEIREQINEYLPQPAVEQWNAEILAVKEKNSYLALLLFHIPCDMCSPTYADGTEIMVDGDAEYLSYYGDSYIYVTSQGITILSKNDEGELDYLSLLQELIQIIRAKQNMEENTNEMDTKPIDRAS